MDSTKKFDKPSPETSANFFSKLFFCWTFPFFIHGYKTKLQVKDIFNTIELDKSSNVGGQLERYWNEEVEMAKRNGGSKPSLLRAIRKTFIKSYSICGMWLFLQNIVIRLLQPIALSEYIRSFQHNDSPENLYVGWISAVLVSLLSFSNIFQQNIVQDCQRIGLRCRAACCSLIYRKMLKLNQSSLNQIPLGKIINLLSNDVQRFDRAFTFMHFLWFGPIQVVIAAYIIFDNVGLAGISGVVALFLQVFVLEGYLSRLQGKLRSKIAQRTDNRLKLMHEIIAGIQVIKMYSWEKPFEKFVGGARKSEIEAIFKTSIVKVISISFKFCTDRLCVFLMVLTLVLLDQPVIAHVIFSMSYLMNLVKISLAMHFSIALSAFAEMKVSIKRIEEFLLAEEKNIRNSVNDSDKEIGSIKLNKVCASWTPNQITLLDVNLEIEPGTLCCIVGNVGSGKTSLLQILLRELPVQQGIVEVIGDISYSSQKPWVFVSNIRNNILFGKPFDETRYNTVVDVCALQKDFHQLTNGDETVVGESGATLSGGQKTRINLARSVYREADIYLFDDPLSAVDSTVAQHLFQKCIKDFLCNKTRILITQQLQFLEQADLIVVVNNGKIENIGSLNQLRREIVLEEFVKSNSEENEQSNYQNVKEIKIIRSNTEANDKKENPKETEKLISKKSVSPISYAKYYQSGANSCCLVLICLIFIVAQALCHLSDIWLMHWINVDQHQTNLTNSSDNVQNEYFYLNIYTGLLVSGMILISLRILIYFKITINASVKLHKQMFIAVFQAPMRFFDLNPSGRILNRFSNDLGIVDESLPMSGIETFQTTLWGFGILFIVIYITPLMIVPTVLLGVCFLWLRNAFLATSQDLKRLEGSTRSPVLSHVSASLEGISTIRACKEEKLVVRDFDNLQDQYTGASFMSLVAITAFGIYLNLICIIFVILQIFYFLIMDDGNTKSGSVGLAISQSLMITGLLQFSAMRSAFFANAMTSVERIFEYIKVEKEGAFESLPITKPISNWPFAGKIIFKNVYLTYDRDDEPVLKNLNIEILPGEKIGIVGRTGAGKSSLIASLFRLAHISGAIEIDGVNIESIGLSDLRKNISISPQKPVLFSMTIKNNLDPFDRVDDENLWKTLENVELKNIINSLRETVKGGGSNFSVGQQQLICLARAIVRNNKILVMDEPTANVDPQTDELIQKTIRQEFRDCTILTVAHRLNTVIDSDKVLVMENGEAVEFDHPHLLLQNPNGYFTKMVNKLGDVMSLQLQTIAKELYNNKKIN